MLKRKVESKLQEWKKGKKALLIYGARQVGKTFIIDKFTNEEFKYVVKIDFSERDDLVDSFAMLKKSDDILTILYAYFGQQMVENQTVVFFDEIQIVYKRREELKQQGIIYSNSQDIITAMKHLSMDGRYRFILSGSLLGVVLNNITLYPLGYMEEIQMFPLDFEEYLWARGTGTQSIDYLRNCFENKLEVDDNINKTFLGFFREYVLVGGMPEAVASFVSNNNLYEVQKIHENITNKYIVDITNYASEYEKKLMIKEVYRAIPSELNAKNKRFMHSHITQNNKKLNEGFLEEYLWLTNAGVAIPVYNVTIPEIPLTLSSERKTLKIFLNDTGLLCSQMLEPEGRISLLFNEKEINYGAPYENAVAKELDAHGFFEKLFYYNSKKHGEVDFLLEYKGDILPIEIKSGKPNEMNIYNHTALNNVIKLYDIQNAYVLGACNVCKETEVITQFPVYMIMFLSR